ncbi:hypothetical protein FQN49_007381 [Arthroderma sp. PD_2]|nr:hypothetical protein FQN49_007381 [Arthroderma sp. PD_2]
MNSIRRGVHRMHNRAKASASARKRILNPSMEGAGTRVFPPANPPLDKNIGVRLDKGEKVQGKPGFLRLKLQVNKGAEDPTLKKLANENSHRVLATIDVDTTQEPTEENLAKFFDDLEERLTEGDDE